ncbi:unnamed protein product, partial [Amoebophrya sp. A25]
SKQHVSNKVSKFPETWLQLEQSTQVLTQSQKHGWQLLRGENSQSWLHWCNSREPNPTPIIRHSKTMATTNNCHS